MPATTRSANKQASLEDVGAGNVKDARAPAKTAKSKSAQSTSSKKRKITPPSQPVDNKTYKKAKSSPDSDAKDDADSSDAIIINRAPVLELWASCVAHFLHPSVSWSTCLSVGGAISTITAISKGRSIGKIDKPDPGEAEEKKKKRQEKEKKVDLDEVEVMSFNVKLDKNGQAMVGGKPKKSNEETLKKKFGPEQYDKAKKAFEDALRRWKGKEEDLNSRAFGMYEDFRPSIPPGQTGWGRKGQLNLDTIRCAVGDD